MNPFFTVVSIEANIHKKSQLTQTLISISINKHYTKEFFLHEIEKKKNVKNCDVNRSIVSVTQNNKRKNVDEHVRAFACL